MQWIFVAVVRSEFLVSCLLWLKLILFVAALHGLLCHLSPSKNIFKKNDLQLIFSWVCPQCYKNKNFICRNLGTQRGSNRLGKLPCIHWIDVREAIFLGTYKMGAKSQSMVKNMISSDQERTFFFTNTNHVISKILWTRNPAPSLISHAWFWL